MTKPGFDVVASGGRLDSPDADAMAIRTVLVADDDENMRQWLQISLEADGYRVITAASGKEALERVAEVRPDLILLDVVMPGMDGFETTRRLKRHRGVSTVPVILVTTLEDRGSRLEGLEAGAEDFLSKPVDPTELMVRVRNLMRLKVYNDRLLEQNRDLERRVMAQTLEIREQCIGTVMALTRAAEYRDETTGAHVNRIRHYCVELAGALGMGADFREQIFYSSPMHDIGKLGIPDDILLKPGGFDADEWRVMRTHTTLGREILEGYNSPVLEMGKDIAQYHHECVDGSGYPFGLMGEDIPLAARLMAVCDVYDALRSQRPYKSAMDHEVAVDIMIQGDRRTRPEQFDPDVLGAFHQHAQRFDEIYEARSL